MTKIFTLVYLIVLTVSLGACNTMRGLGKDVERGGERVQDAATGTRNKN